MNIFKIYISLQGNIFASEYTGISCFLLLWLTLCVRAIKAVTVYSHLRKEQRELSAVSAPGMWSENGNFCSLLLPGGSPLLHHKIKKKKQKEKVKGLGTLYLKALTLFYVDWRFNF